MSGYPQRVVFVVEKRSRAGGEWNAHDSYGWPDIAQENAEYLALTYPSAEWRVTRYEPAQHKSVEREAKE